MRHEEVTLKEYFVLFVRTGQKEAGIGELSP